MKETENKAKMLNFEKSISSTKNIFPSLRWYKNEFYDIFGQKRTDMNQKNLP